MKTKIILSLILDAVHWLMGFVYVTVILMICYTIARNI